MSEEQMRWYVVDEDGDINLLTVDANGKRRYWIGLGGEVCSMPRHPYRYSVATNTEIAVAKLKGLV